MFGRLSVSQSPRRVLLRRPETNVDHKSGIWLAGGHRQVYSHRGGLGGAEGGRPAILF